MDTLHTISIISLIISAACMVIIIVDIIAGHRQNMMIMNFVYPITALYAGLLALVVYYTIGRKTTSKAVKAAKANNKPPPSKQKPFWQSVGVGALHCGSGCTLGDILAETLLLFVPFFLFGRAIFGAWVVDYVFAFVIGIIFQYYSIKPMKGLSPKQGLIAALKADTLSLTSWQIGMYGWMAISTFLIFKHELEASDPVFWFMMQIAMIFGFLTAYPVNWWLLRRKIKEVM
ncbi:MAG TPA: DUF4396 domain-containing protein [Bacteroidales bacterium]|nr:DUF4396 domain-containing protein [Bacteroidales bacterium]